MARPRGSRNVRGWVMSPKAQVAAGLLSSDDVEEVTQGGVKVTQVKAGREIDATKLTESQQKAVMEARKAGSATKTESAPASSMERYRDAIKKEESRLSKKYSGNYESAVVSEAKTDYGKKIAQRAHDNAQKAIEVFKTNKEQGLKLRDEAIKDWTSLGESRYGIKAKVSPILTKMAVEKLDKSLGIKELSWSEKRARTAGLSKQTVNIKKKNSDIKVAFMSVLEISDKRKQVLLDEGLADYIMKPFDKDSLLERIDNILKE